MDAWYEEEERIYVHARDPYLRADARRSSRHVAVEVGGVQVADTRRPVLLDETGLITRYYMPLADVRERAARAERDVHGVPVQGSLRLLVGARAAAGCYADAAWCYRLPLPDVGAIAGHLCFWQEREDTVMRVDGEVPPRPLGTPGGDGAEALPPWRARHVMPPPESMRGVPAGRAAARPRAPEQPRRGPAGRRHGHGPRTRRRPSALALLTVCTPGV